MPAYVYSVKSSICTRLEDLGDVGILSLSLSETGTDSRTLVLNRFI